MRRSSRITALALSGGLIVLPLALISPASAAEEPQSQTFNVMGLQSFTVPTGITCLQFVVDGPAGGAAESGGAGGHGGRVSGWYATTPGEVLGIHPGDRGSNGANGGDGGDGGTVALAGGDGGIYPNSYDWELSENVIGGGGAGGSLLQSTTNGNAAIAVAGGGGGGGGESVEPAPPGGGDGGDGGQDGADGGGPVTGNGGVAGASGTGGIGERPDTLPEPSGDDTTYAFIGGGGGGGGAEGASAGESIYLNDGDSGGGAGGGGGGTSFSGGTVINPTTGVAPGVFGEITLTWQQGFTGTCGDEWDPVGPTDPGSDDGDGDTSNAGSTFDTGVTAGDSSNALPVIGLVGGLLIAGAGVALYVRPLRKS